MRKCQFSKEYVIPLIFDFWFQFKPKQARLLFNSSSILSENKQPNMKSHSHFQSLVSLPITVYMEIQSFLNNEEYREFTAISNSYHFHEVRIHTLRMALNNKYSVLYYENNEFHYRVNNLLKNPKKQLNLLFEIGIPLSAALSPVEIFQNIHSMNIFRLQQEISDLSLFKSIEILKFNECRNLTSCNGLENGTIVELYLHQCSKLEDLSAVAMIPTLQFFSLIGECRKAKDVSPLRNIPSIHVEECSQLYYCDTPISWFGGGQQQKISLCDFEVSDEFLQPVSSNLKILKISSFSTSQLTVDSFSKVEELSLECALASVIRTGIDFSNLTKLRLKQCQFFSFDDFLCSPLTVVSLVKCMQVYCVDSLASVKTLRKLQLDSLHNLKDITMFGRLSTLYVKSCPIESIKRLGKIRKLFLINCQSLFSLEGITNKNKYVYIDRCNQIKDFSILNNCNKVSISQCQGYEVTNIPTIAKNGCYLSLSKLPNCKDLLFPSSSSWNPYLICLSNCEIKTLKGLTKVPIVHIRYCEALLDISKGLKENTKVILEYLPNLHDISCLVNVPFVHIVDCTGIKSYSCLKKVPELRVFSRKEPHFLPSTLLEELTEMNVSLRSFPSNYNELFPSTFF
jgi:hypothetical protein